MANRLTDEQSRYLMQHAENPVDWHPWGPEAFELARSEGRPILASIGYSSCHWCHVMAHESFEDVETADTINRNFIPVKVDREEYPDVDGYYMSFLTQLAGSGGWPLNVLINPNLAPFYGFTYLPSDSLRSTLTYARTEYDKHEAMREQTIRTQFSQRSLSADTISSQVERVRLEAPNDSRGPQFPQPLYLALALSDGHREFVRDELERLVARGLFDHVEGGWFRYTVDPKMKIPHFEKMLYDQATLLYLCAQVHEVAPTRSAYAISGTVRWLSEHMRLPSGLYGSATDADTEEGEGRYYTLETPVSEEERRLFRLDESGVHDERPHPWIDFETLLEDPEFTASLIEERRAARKHRVTPALDTKAVFSWNAFLAYALYECHEATGDASIRVLADGLTQALDQAAAEGVSHVVYETGERRGYRYLQDYAAYLLLLAAMPEHSAQDERTESLLADIEAHFVYEDRVWHTDRREFESQALWQDTPFPSGGSMLLTALVRLGRTDHRLFGLLHTNIVEVAAEHPVFFPLWIRGFRDHFYAG